MTKSLVVAKLKKQELQSVQDLKPILGVVLGVTQTRRVSYSFLADISLHARRVKLYSKLVPYVEWKRRVLLKSKV
jgi:hypothetical protein